MKCPRCHNENLKYIYELHGHYYCRKCISFSRVDINKERHTIRKIYPSKPITYHLNFELSSQQKNISHLLVSHYKQKINSYLFACCGSGKTEIVFEVIAYALSIGHRVCFTIPRKELVKELYERIKESFTDIDIGILYGGVKENIDAQFIVCTTHQLYRFENDIGFDLMIADEVDAFPFYNNELLQTIFKQCTLGSFIKLSATFVDEDIIDGKLLMMNRRYHGHLLPIPSSYICPSSFQKYIILIILLVYKKRWLIYVPTIHQAEALYHFLSSYVDIGLVHSKKDNEHVIKKIKEKKVYALITTTLLERGMTVENVHVIVYLGEHNVFDRRTLIQIAGRVGRKPNYPDGHIIVLCSCQSKEVKECIKTIKRLNKMPV